MIYQVQKQVLNFNDLEVGTSLFIVPSSLVEDLIHAVSSKGYSVIEKSH